MSEVGCPGVVHVTEPDEKEIKVVPRNPRPLRQVKGVFVKCENSVNILPQAGKCATE